MAKGLLKGGGVVDPSDALKVPKVRNVLQQDGCCLVDTYQLPTHIHSSLMEDRGMI